MAQESSQTHDVSSLTMISLTVYAQHQSQGRRQEGGGGKGAIAPSESDKAGGTSPPQNRLRIQTVAIYMLYSCHGI